MKIISSVITPIRRQNYRAKFCSETDFQENKIIEKELLTLDSNKSIMTNPINPSQNIFGININRTSDKSIELVSKAGHKTGNITYNPNSLQPDINLLVGSFQPIIELEDRELGIKVLLTRKSDINGDNLNINYKDITKSNLVFGHRLVVTEGYKPEKIEKVVLDYFKNNSYPVKDKSAYANMLKQDYTFVGLGAGYGTRLKAISDLEDNNKLSTRYPGGAKSLFEVSVLDTISRSGISGLTPKFIKDSPDNISGTAGALVKGLKDGTIPVDKPLVVLMGDNFNNIDLAKVLYEHEQSQNAGISLVVKEYNKDNILDMSPIKINSDNEVVSFFSKVNENNYSEILKETQTKSGQYLVSIGMTVVQPCVLKILKGFADQNGNADFTEFIGLMYNIMSKPNESLKLKYLEGLKSAGLDIADLTYSDGTPRPIYDDKSNKQTLKVVVAKDINNNAPFSFDAGTVEDFINVANEVKKQKNIAGMNQNFLDSIINCVDDNGIIYMNANAKEKLVKFKEKYKINKITGNVIVQSTTPITPITNTDTIKQKPELKVLSNSNELYNLTKDQETSQNFVSELMNNPENLVNKSQEMIAKYGLNAFLEWYLDENGYYGAYEKYIENLYEKSDSIEALLKHSPNWAPWKLEEKYWLLKNPTALNYSKDKRQNLFYKDMDTKREQPFIIGELPNIFYSTSSFEELVNRLKNQEIIDGTICVGGRYYDVKRLKGGELNDKFIYSVKYNGETVILKLDRINVEDADTVNGRSLSLFEKKTIRKNKHLAPDSTYFGVCISKYLELNGSKNIPKMLYYNYSSNAAIYEYIEDSRGDLFQKGFINDETDSLNKKNDAYLNLNKLGIFINDTSCRNILIDKTKTEKVIDLGHSSFIMPFKLGAKHYNISLPNACGPDIREIYAGLLVN